LPLGEAAPIDQAVHAWRAAVQKGHIDRDAERELIRRLWQPIAAALPAGGGEGSGSSGPRWRKRRRRLSRLTIIFITIFVDLIGFGIVLPLLPFYAGDFGATPATVGLLVAIHPAMQFLFGPIWGRLSDRIGRRPILLLGLLGSAASYLIFGLAANLWWLFASRIMQGIAGANVPVAQAYIADSTDPQDRTRGMGLVGAAFGLGFIAGPAIAGALVGFGYAAPGLLAAGLSFANAVAAYFYLPESLSEEVRARVAAEGEERATKREGSLAARLRLALVMARHPGIGMVMIIFALATFVFAAFTTVFPLWLGISLDYDARHAGYLMAYLGLLLAIVQGRMLGPLVREFGERKLLVGGTVTLTAAYALFPFARGLLLLSAVLIPIALGTGVNWPTLSSLASQYAPAETQGGVLGVMQSLSALGRMTGSAWAGWVFGRWGAAAPFGLNAVVMSLAAVFAVVLVTRAPAPRGPRPEPVAPASV
jgi:MFS family permease